SRRKDIVTGGGSEPCWAGSRCCRYRRDRWIVVESTAESVDKLVGVRRGVAKVGHKWGNFALCWRGWQTVGSAPDGKSFHDVANGRDRCTMVPLSRSKRRFRLKGLRRQMERRGDLP